jgi:hypothetical protein
MADSGRAAESHPDLLRSSMFANFPNSRSSGRSQIVTVFLTIFLGSRYMVEPFAVSERCLVTF